MRPGTLPLFTFRGIRVSLHWSWGLVAVVQVLRGAEGGSVLASALEYLALFSIVLLHEFGHAFACRSTGGKAEDILLWPLGGVAYVQPPQRPGAQLWSIAAGPLVNVALLPITFGFAIAAGLVAPDSPLDTFATGVGAINLGLLIFNLLPIYPLDGGQIVRSLLWFPLGRDRSLLVTAGIGLVAAVGGGLAGLLLLDSWWLALLGLWAASRSWGAIRLARVRAALLSGPTHPIARCPSCGQAPPLGMGWPCPNGHLVDAYSLRACPECGERLGPPACIECGQASPLEEWLRPSVSAS